MLCSMKLPGETSDKFLDMNSLPWLPTPEKRGQLGTNFDISYIVFI